MLTNVNIKSQRLKRNHCPGFVASIRGIMTDVSSCSERRRERAVDGEGRRFQLQEWRPEKKGKKSAGVQRADRGSKWGASGRSTSWTNDDFPQSARAFNWLLISPGKSLSLTLSPASEAPILETPAILPEDPDCDNHLLSLPVVLDCVSNNNEVHSVNCEGGSNGPARWRGGMHIVYGQIMSRDMLIKTGTNQLGVFFGVPLNYN